MNELLPRYRGDGSVESLRLEAEAFLKLYQRANSAITVTIEDAVGIAQMARDLNIPVTLGLTQIYLIEGKPSPSAPLLHRLVLRSGLLEHLSCTYVYTEDDTVCTVTMRRRGGLEHTESFSWKEALSSGYALTRDGHLKSNWARDGKTMLKWRATKRCEDYLFGDVVGGLYSPDELGGDGNVARSHEAPLEAREPTIDLHPCQGCGQHVIPSFKWWVYDGEKGHIRVNCPNCGHFIEWAERTPANIAAADAASIEIETEKEV